MKSLGILVVTLFLSLSVFGKESEPKTFLVIFKSKELKSKDTSLKAIESQFSTAYKTRAYSGNSELALIIDIPKCDFDACFLGQFLITSGKGIDMQLQDIAFRVVDMTANKKSLNTFLTAFEENQKREKNEKRNPTPAP
ncbi:hypothetical protein LZF95_02910 [Algoriphagus sp. AGSA1]|uniref:hypothetical protein n=1 Tax=Algoriphagus sp. AGSA1 TaxID=2907213 RepID=UPI001F1EBF0F|nr:hypothetical protein [Algoriphagus sp. AGSA1]MCE7053613.1 hypothetical protein [Algoriphagus sp. AGSA1]